MEYRKLKELAFISISNVDKKTSGSEKPVRLCNFVDVYRNWAITAHMTDQLMVATAKQSEIDRFSLHKGDVCITKDSETKDDIGMATYIADDIENLVLGYHCARISPKKELLSGKFLNAFLHTMFVRKFYELNASGSGQRYTLSLDAIGEIPVPVLPLEEQRKRAEVLSLIDRKIEINKTVNDNLQHQLRILYDYWFTQFDFPNAERKPYRSSGGHMIWNSLAKMQIPDGWEACSLKDAIQHIHTGLNPRDNFTLGNGNIKYVTVKNLTLNGSIDFKGCDTIDEDARRKVHNRSDIMIGDILFASIAPLGRCYLITTPPTNWDINESVFSIRPNNILSPEYLYAFLTSDRFIYSATNRSTGSIFKGIRINDLMDTKVIVPTADVLYAFSRFANKILMQKSIISQENEALLNQRNWILPMLMSGQATIAD